MAKLLTEKQTLKRLGIPDFRHLTKSQAIQMASMLNQMSPEVAKKALEQFPEFASTTKEIIAAYKDSLQPLLQSNDASVQTCYTSCNAIIATLSEQLQSENLSEETRRQIIDGLLECQRNLIEIDRANKDFLLGIWTRLGTVAVGALGLLGVAIGLLELTKGTPDEEEDPDENADYYIEN